MQRFLSRVSQLVRKLAGGATTGGATTGGARPERGETDRLLGAILDTPPIATEPCTTDSASASTIGVHVLIPRGLLRQSLWALKSFYHFAGVACPLTVHLQGQDTNELSTALSRHFPHARQITQQEADAVIEPWLQDQGLHRLLAMRRQFILMMKLVDLRLFARTTTVLYFDTDVLFFRCPLELTARPAGDVTDRHLFMTDVYPSYCITPAQAESDLGIAMTPFANTGVMRLVTDAIDLAACERYLAHPSLAVKHWHLEQTLHALYASAQGRLQLLPATYSLANGPHPQLETLIARHYASPVRSLFAAEGVAHLVRSGLLPALSGGRER